MRNPPQGPQLESLLGFTGKLIPGYQRRAIKRKGVQKFKFMPLWIEREPNYFSMMPYGYIHIRMSLKIGQEVRIVLQNILLQLRPIGTIPSPDLEGPTVGDALGFPNLAVAAALLPSVTDPIEGYTVTGVNTAATETTRGVVLIENNTLATFLDTHILSRMRALQTRTTVYKKIELDLHYSKEQAGIVGRGSLKAIRQYSNYKLILPPTGRRPLCGTIDEGTPPSKGAVSINMYPSSISETTALAVRVKQQDKPGRLLIRGCAVNEEEALRGSTIIALAQFMKEGAAIVTGGNWALVPVVDLLGDLWLVRATQPSGYVNLASKNKKGENKVSPEKPANKEGGSE